ncbi:hypothetical protein JVT61DRAFT_5041 [Boletus reticuloceps]|uniref:Uncharacterized protein n=1 Tax=Boletus reticuloceps TaxID=495285 RepID=A0A8I2YYV6_9AGAM|nr:hypothetical protein JVT61DRAFT_5041 [Boletus reticuloceps]
MPLLGGLFYKRNNSLKNGPTPTESSASSVSNRDSTDGGHVFLPPPPPMYNLPAAASSSKLKLPFRRKPQLAQPNPKDTVVSLNDTAPPRISSVTSDSGHDLPPPPRKSLFGVYSNDSHHSVHSLPNEPSSHVHPDTHARLSSSDFRTETHLPHPHKKSPGLFSWARERTKSKPPPPPSSVSSVSSTSPPLDDASSFNLKSFRHVRADSPATHPQKMPMPSSDSLLPPARPRPRGSSVASDSSQRMSIAAFREAQARSRANSPVPSFRPPSTADTLRVDANGRKRASTVSVVSGTDQPQLNKNIAAAPMPSFRPGSSADTSSDDSDSEEDEDEEVDSDGEPLPKPARKRTITRRADGVRARSDAGNSPVTTPIDQPSHESPKLSNAAPSLTNHALYTRTRASVSTSALTPSAAARRASILAAANSASSSHIQSRTPPPQLKDDSDQSTDSEYTDSEDMPLSDLLAPRRPGSSASNRSSSRPRMPAKPLIDINSLAGGPPLITPILRHEDSLRNMNAKRKEQGGEKDQPFSIPAVLALSSSTSPPISPSVSKHNAMPTNKPAIPTHYRKSSSDVPALAKSEGPDNDDDLMNAIRLVGSLDKAQESILWNCQTL